MGCALVGGSKGSTPGVGDGEASGNNGFIFKHAKHAMLIGLGCSECKSVDFRQISNQQTMLLPTTLLILFLWPIPPQLP